MTGYTLLLAPSGSNPSPAGGLARVIKRRGRLGIQQRGSFQFFESGLGEGAETIGWVTQGTACGR